VLRATLIYGARDGVRCVRVQPEFPLSTPTMLCSIHLTGSECNCRPMACLLGAHDDARGDEEPLPGTLGELRDLPSSLSRGANASRSR
jgi:hypothetical protein